MSNPTPNSQIIALMNIGVSPSTASLAVRRAESDGLLSPGASTVHSYITDADIERAKVRWWYSDDVPDPLKLILEAPE